MQISVEFQNRFKELTEEAGFGNKTVAAEKIGITYATFSKIYNYGIVPKVSVLIKIADRFFPDIEKFGDPCGLFRCFVRLSARTNGCRELKFTPLYL